MPDDGNRYELYDGELRVVPSPILRHQIVSVRLLEALLDYRRLHGGLVIAAPFDIVLIVRSGAVGSSTIPGLTVALAPLFERL
jgi:hypothetical protein